MEIGAYQAKTHLSHLLGEVAQGKRFTITKHGVPVAVLAPFGSDPSPQATAQVVEELTHFRAGITLGDLTLRELIQEGRR